MCLRYWGRDNINNILIYKFFPDAVSLLDSEYKMATPEDVESLTAEDCARKVGIDYQQFWTNSTFPVILENSLHVTQDNLIIALAFLLKIIERLGVSIKCVGHVQSQLETCILKGC